MPQYEIGKKLDRTINYLLANQGSPTATIQTLSGLAPIWDLNGGEWAYIDSPEGNVNLTTSNVPTPGAGVLHFKQDAVGSRTLQVNSVSVEVDPASDAITRIDFSYDGTNYVYDSSYSSGGSSSGVLTEYSGINKPSSPANGITIFASKKSGNPLAAFIDPSSVLTELQSALFSGTLIYGKPTAGAATFTSIGYTASSVGSPSQAGNGYGNYFVTQQRVNYASAATAGSSALYRITTGLTIGQWGFFATMQFGVQAAVATTRLFVGLYPQGTAIGNVEPSTLLSCIGVGADSGEANLSIINASATTNSKVSLGTNFPANTSATDWYELRICWYPGATSIFWSLHRKNTGHFINGTITTNLPSATAVLAHQFWINNGATASAVTIGVGTFYSVSQ